MFGLDALAEHVCYLFHSLVHSYSVFRVYFGGGGAFALSCKLLLSLATISPSKNTHYLLIVEFIQVYSIIGRKPLKFSLFNH